MATVQRAEQPKLLKNEDSIEKGNCYHKEEIGRGELTSNYTVQTL